MNLDQTDDKRAVDALTARFYDAFTNDHDAALQIDCLYDVFIPEGVIVKNSGSAPEVYDLERFVEPRRALLARGSLRDFAERQLSERTEIVGNIAQRLTTYGKSGLLEGEAFEVRGVKTIQFVKRRPIGKLARSPGTINFSVKRIRNSAVCPILASTVTAQMRIGIVS